MTKNAKDYVSFWCVMIVSGIMFVIVAFVDTFACDYKYVALEYLMAILPLVSAACALVVGLIMSDEDWDSLKEIGV